MTTLRDAKIGQTVIVKKLHGEGAIKRRIMDMGITKGIDVYDIYRTDKKLRFRKILFYINCQNVVMNILNREITDWFT